MDNDLVRILLIRHAESVDNVAGLYGGVSDAELTNHGILQTARLARHLQDTYGRFTHVFSSDLQRALRTGNAIVDHQNSLLADKGDIEPSDVCYLQVLSILREQDFGSLERQPFSAMAKSNLQSKQNAKDWIAPETKVSMDERADAFLDGHIFPLLTVSTDGEGKRALISARKSDCKFVVAVVSHGMLLSRLWKRLLARCPDWSQDVVLDPMVEVGPRGLEHLGGWANTGYLDLLLDHKSSKAPSPETATMSSGLRDDEVSDNGTDSDGVRRSVQRKIGRGTQILVIEPTLQINVRAVNVTDHLRGLKKTRGGIGSAAHDESQRSIDSFFKRRKAE